MIGTIFIHRSAKQVSILIIVYIREGFLQNYLSCGFRVLQRVISPRLPHAANLFTVSAQKHLPVFCMFLDFNSSTAQSLGKIYIQQANR